MVKFYLKATELNAAVARTVEVRRGVRDVAMRIYFKAGADLSHHRGPRRFHEVHHSIVRIEHGATDWYVVLDDTGDDGAANIIEDGRPPGSRSGRMTGLKILESAVRAVAGRRYFRNTGG